MRRLMPPILVLLMLLTVLPGALAVQSPDGSPVAADGGWQVVEARELDIGVWHAVLSPDGQRLAGVGPDNTFCTWDVDTLESECAGGPMPIRPESVTWSPDGTAVAFAFETIPPRYESDIHVYELETGELINLTDDGVEGALDDITDTDSPVDAVPTWSPDSQHLAFVRSFHGDGESGTTAIMHIDRDGGELVEVAQLDVAQSLAVWLPMYWLPDGTLVYSQIVHDISDPDNGIYTVDIEEGGSPELITPGGEDTDLAGPMIVDVADGKAIVFSYWPAGEYGFGGAPPVFWLVDLSTGHYEALPFPGEAGEGTVLMTDVSFSPDGSTAIMSTNSLDGAQLMTLDIASGEITPVEPEPRNERYLSGGPQWAANDTVLLQRTDGPMLFTLVQSGESAVATPAASPAVSAAAGGSWQIAEERELNIDTRFAALSPDGQQLAGVSPDDTICVWSVETLEPQCAGEELPIRAETITWSPDGTAVAFALDAIRLAYESDIYVYETETGELVNLTDDGLEGGFLDHLDQDPPIDDVPVWSPDSQQIAFARSFRGDEEPGSTAIMRIDRDGGEPVEVLSLGTRQPLLLWMPMFWQPDGSLVYSQMSTDLDDPGNGVWTVDAEGGSPTLLMPGGGNSDAPGPMISDVADGKAIVYSSYLMQQFAFEDDQPIFWLIDLVTGDREPLPTPPAGSGDMPWVLEVAFSPDGGTVIKVTSTSEGSLLVELDIATGTFTQLQPEPSDVRYLPGAPQWATNDTVLLQRPEGPLLFTLVPANAPVIAPPVATPAASPVAANADWRIADVRDLDLGSRHAALSPDGKWLAGIGPDNTLCIWDVATLGSSCVEEHLPIRPETIAWAPDSLAVAFALDAILQLHDSDIFVLDRETSQLENLTDDGVEGSVFDAERNGAPIDDVPVWSPDGQRIAFVRSMWGEEESSTVIMTIDRAGGDPVTMLPLDVDQPLAVWAPMRWLPDGTLVYAQSTPSREHPLDGIWKVGVDDGSSPLQVIPGTNASDIPGAVASDAATGRATVYSYVHLQQFGPDEETPNYWLVDLATGELASILVPGDGDPVRVISAGFSPDGGSVLLGTRSFEGDRLMVLDVASGEITPLDDEPRDMAFTEHAAQWAGNDTVLVLTAGDPLLITLERMA